MLYLSADDPTNAILCLQSAIRSDPTDVHAWGGLADAYRARGSYTAAMKAYDKVLRLNPDSVYAELQIGNLKLKLGHNTDAIAHFRKLLEMEPDYVPALKGLAEALLSEARDFLDDHIDANVIDNCQVALEALTKAAEARPEVKKTHLIWQIQSTISCLFR
jgi:superkiller protein 3